MDILKIAGAAIVTVVCVAAVRQHNKEYSVAVEAAGAAVILLMAFSGGESIFSFLSSWFNDFGAGEIYFSLLIKAFIAVVATQIASEACRDSGNGMLASCVEFAGRLVVITVSLPLLKAVLSITVEMLNG